ncbi:MAG: response regulator [Pirellulaceae bacterium]
MNQLPNPVLLVVDSDALTLTATAATLHSLGYEVHCAQDRMAAVQAAKTLALDLIICDVNVGHDDGMSICEDIRNLPDRNDVPVMFISSCQMPAVASRSFQNGSAFFLKKPFAPQLLIDLVDKALWMPHLVKSHVHKPHIPLGAFANNAMPRSQSVEQ